MKRFVACLLLATASMAALARVPATPGDPLQQQEALSNLAKAWNQARNNGDRDALLALIHPDERDFADLHLPAKSSMQRGNAKVTLVSATPKKDRVALVIERSWGGSKPGKILWKLEASEYNGFWFLRYPGGDLVAPRGVRALASPTKKDSAGSATTDIKLKVPDAAPSGQITGSRASVTVIAPPPPKPVVTPPPLTAGAKKFESWTRQCNQKPNDVLECYVEHTATKNDTKKLFVNLRLTPDSQGQLAAKAATPNRVLLNPGVEFFFGSAKPIKASFWICNETSCELSFDIPSATRKTLEKLRTIQADFFDEDGSKVRFEISLAGLSEALSSITTEGQSNLARP